MSAVNTDSSDQGTGGEGDGGGVIGLENGGEHPPEVQNPGICFVRAVPVMALKLESRACGLLVAWARDAVILCDTLCTAEGV